MKSKLLLFLILLITSFSFGQQTLFSYDAAGNQISVYVEILLVTTGRMSTETSLQSNPIYKDVKYYPNPVKSELYMEWEIIDENTLSNISVINEEGILLMDYKDLNNLNKYTLTFESYSQGIYFVEFFYSNGERKNFKIIKQ